MIIIREKKNGYGRSCYYKVLKKGKGEEEVLLKKVDIKPVEVKLDGFDYMYLYDTQRDVIKEVFNYLNFESAYKAYNSRSVSLRALKLLYNFTEIFDLEVLSINMPQAINLKHFLYGFSVGKAVDYKLELIDKRGPDSVNSYLSTYRDFFKYLGKDNTPFHEKKVKKHFFQPGIVSSNSCKKEVAKYKLNEKSQQNNKRAPRYTCKNQLGEIIKLIRSTWTIREEIIVRLGYENGMRLGEVLGLTLEDIKTTPEEISYREPFDLGELVVRNRRSDKYYQKAKKCMKVTSIEDYTSKPYKTEGYGYELVRPTILLLTKIDVNVNRNCTKNERV